MKYTVPFTGWASLLAQMVKNLPAVQETGVRFLGWKDPCSRKWQPTPAFSPGEVHGQRSHIGYIPRGRKDSGTTEAVSQSVSSVAQSCSTLCDPMNCSTPGLPVYHQLPEFTQTHIHRVSDAIQPSHPL